MNGLRNAPTPVITMPPTTRSSDIPPGKVESPVLAEVLEVVVTVDEAEAVLVVLVVLAVLVVLPVVVDTAALPHEPSAWYLSPRSR